jgi:hypothetical protein
VEDDLHSIEQQLAGKRDFDTPPLHLWQPALSGDIPISITASGEWFHDGGKIKRPALVNLFASILRREEDGEYYLVTPVEKWRIEVALHPLMVVDVDAIDYHGETVLRLTLNTGKTVDVGDAHPLVLDPGADMIATVALPHGLTALFTRAAWYRLVDMAATVEDRLVVRSAGTEYVLGDLPGPH